MTGPHRVLERVRRLAAEVTPLLAEAGAGAVDEAVAAFDDPLRLAIVGRVSSGKSTLVNALVGRLVAPTSAGECTRVVTWYRFGAPDALFVHLVDGSVRGPLRLPDGRVPETLDVPVEEVDHLEVRLAARQLHEFNLIDTPGLESGSEGGDLATRRAILGQSERSRLAASQADGLVYLIGDAARRSEVDFLDEFKATSGTLSTHSLNAVGVLAQADRASSGPFDPRDPFDNAEEQASRLEVEYPGGWSTVVPVSGLLGQTARSPDVNRAVAEALAALAPLDAVTLALRLHEPALARLTSLFGPYGVTHGREVAQHGAGALKAWCEERSGVRRLEEVVRAELVPRAPLLKAMRAVAVLGAAARELSGDARDEAMTLVETAQLEPDLHPLEEVRALTAVAAIASSSGAAQRLASELSLVVAAPEPATLLGAEPETGREQLAQLARRRSSAATGAAALAVRPAEASAGRVLARSYDLLSRRLAGPAEAGHH